MRYADSLDRVDEGIRRIGARMDALEIMRSDASVEEKIAKVRALYERPGTAGEREAAAAALRRMGVDPDHVSATGSQPREKKATLLKKTYRVVFTLEGRDFEYQMVAPDEIAAESAARGLFKKQWKAETGKKVPEWPNGPKVSTSRVY